MTTNPNSHAIHGIDVLEDAVDRSTAGQAAHAAPPTPDVAVGLIGVSAGPHVLHVYRHDGGYVGTIDNATPQAIAHELQHVDDLLAGMVELYGNVLDKAISLLIDGVEVTREERMDHAGDTRMVDRWELAAFLADANRHQDNGNLTAELTAIAQREGALPALLNIIGTKLTDHTDPGTRVVTEVYPAAPAELDDEGSDS